MKIKYLMNEKSQALREPDFFHDRSRKATLRQKMRLATFRS